MKWVCSVCGYVYEGEQPPEKCPQCKVPADKFIKQEEGKVEWADQHVVGVAKGVDQEIIDGLRANFEGECSEVGMYLAMARVAHREGYPEIGLFTKKNLEMRVEAEAGACAGKKELAAMAKQKNLDAIHDTVHEMAKDEARHGAAFAGLLKRYFG